MNGAVEIPGSGKSSGVRRDYGDSLYVKDATKWWDGYAGEETVVIDDWDPEQPNTCVATLKSGQIIIHLKRK